MKTLELYKSYSETMNRMNQLCNDQKRLQSDGAPAESVNELAKKIAVCGKELRSIVHRITNYNPFEQLKGEAINS